MAIAKLIKTLKPDIVHSVLFEANLVVRLAKLFQKFYLIESLVNTSYSENREFRNRQLKFKNTVIKRIDISTAFLVNHFHSVSKAVQVHYEWVYGKKINCTIIRRGRKAVSNHKSSYELGTQFKLFTIARQEYQKGLIYLFEAIHKSPHNICLKIAGREGDASQELLAYVKANALESKVQFVGFRDDLKDFFLEADAYISGSFFEGSPGSVIEAMSYGLPLILSDIQEHQEIVLENENTIFFPLKDVTEILSIFDKVIQKQYDLEALGQKSLEIFTTAFVEEVIYNEYDVMYKKQLGWN
jgi:glycosyltransferase involved in cell wall biosynthesis